MKPHLVIVCCGLGAALSLALTGCVGGTTGSEVTASRQPVMPTVAPRPPAAPPLGQPESEILAMALGHARANDAPAAVRTIETGTSLAQRTRLATQLVATLAESDPRAAVACAMSFAPGSVRSAGLEIAAPAWARRESETALRWAHDLSEASDASLARRAVVAELVRVNPRGAIERVLALPPGPAREDTLALAATAWARQDPAGATSWVRGLADDALKSRLTSSVGFEVAQRSPDRALALAESLPPGRDRWLLLSAIGQTWVAVDPKAALAWAKGLPTGDARAAAYAGIDTGLGVPAARRVASAPGTRSGSSRTRGGAGAAAALLQGDSPAFTAWLATQPPGLSRDEAILEYVRQRGALEPATTGQWLATLPGGPTRDRAMELYLENILPTAPAEAAGWLRSLPRSDRSDEMIEKTARQWLQTNPAAAEVWLQEMTLPPDRKERLLREAGR